MPVTTPSFRPTLSYDRSMFASDLIRPADESRSVFRDFDRDGVIDKVSFSETVVHFYRGIRGVDDNVEFSESSEWLFTTTGHFSLQRIQNIHEVADLDDDGDLDIVVTVMGVPKFNPVLNQKLSAVYYLILENTTL